MGGALLEREEILSKSRLIAAMGRSDERGVLLEREERFPKAMSGVPSVELEEWFCCTALAPADGAVWF
jgi:hypothetical protein